MKIFQKIVLGLVALLLTSSFLFSRTLSDTLYVSASALNLREQPHTGAEILAVAQYGDAVNVLEEGALTNEASVQEGNWLEVKYGETKGYMHRDYLSTGYMMLMPWSEAPATLPNLHWYALVHTEKGDSLCRATIHIETDPDLGNSVVVGEPYKYKSFLILGSIEPLPEGLVNSNPEQCFTTEPLYPGMSRPVYWTDANSIEQYQLNIFGAYGPGPDGYAAFTNYQIQVSCYSYDTHSSCAQTIFSLPQGQSQWEAVYLLWEGDINQDGWPDFLLMNGQSEYSAAYHLYLGRSPEEGKVVREVASCEEFDRC